jgi:small-conductance mechanosensitive channel
MEQQDTHHSLFDLSIDETAKDHLRKICSWTMIIVIIAVIGYVVAIIKALMPKTQAIQSEGFGVSVSTGQNLASVIFGIIIGLLINYFLYQFSKLTKKGVDGMSQTDLDAGFYNLKIYFVIISVLVIIILAFLLLFLVTVGANAAAR